MPVRKGIRDCILAGMLQDARAQIQDCSARQATQGRGGFNRYRAFRQARDMRCVLYVICCWMCILGKVDAIVGVCCEHFGVTWVYLGAILGNVRAILGLCGRSWVYLGPPWSLWFRL